MTLTRSAMCGICIRRYQQKMNYSQYPLPANKARESSWLWVEDPPQLSDMSWAHKPTKTAKLLVNTIRALFPQMWMIEFLWGTQEAYTYCDGGTRLDDRVAMAVLDVEVTEPAVLMVVYHKVRANIRAAMSHTTRQLVYYGDLWDTLAGTESPYGGRSAMEYTAEVLVDTVVPPGVIEDIGTSVRPVATYSTYRRTVRLGLANTIEPPPPHDIRPGWSLHYNLLP